MRNAMVQTPAKTKRSTEPVKVVATKLQRAPYDATSSGRTMDFSSASDIGPNNALADRATIRKRIRHEMRNNGIAKGVGRNYANVTVGKDGPQIKIHSQNPGWNRLVKQSFQQWAANCEFRRGRSLAQLMHSGVKQFFPCGEFLLVPRIDMNASTRVKLKFLQVRPDRLDTPPGKTFLDGIEVDKDGRAVNYWIQDEDPDNTRIQSSLFGRYTPVPARQMIHVFIEDDPIQMRGEPWMAQMLVAFHKTRRADEGALTALEMAQKFCGFLANTMPDLDVNPELLLPDVVDLEEGTLTTLPYGYKPEQVKPEHPHENWHEFRRDQMATAGRSVCMPVNAVTGDSSDHNFASARFDGLMMIGDVDFVRSEIETTGLQRVFDMWIKEAIAVGDVPHPAFPYTVKWLWPFSEAHTDPLKAEKARQVRVETGYTTVGQEVLMDGRDDDDHHEALKEEIKRYREDGLIHPMDRAASSPVDEEPDKEDEDDDESTKEKGKAKTEAA